MFLWHSRGLTITPNSIFRISDLDRLVWPIPDPAENASIRAIPILNTRMAHTYSSMSIPKQWTNQKTPEAGQVVQAFVYSTKLPWQLFYLMKTCWRWNTALCFFLPFWVLHLMFLDAKTCSVWTKVPFQVSSLRPFNKHKLQKKKLFGNFYAYDAIIGLNNELK